MNVTRESHVKVLGRWVRVPNWMIREPWSAAKIARIERQAQALGDLQTFIMKSPLFPAACVVLFFAGLLLVTGAIDSIRL